jgi:hypothetical protein
MRWIALVVLCGCGAGVQRGQAGGAQRMSLAASDPVVTDGALSVAAVGQATSDALTQARGCYQGLLDPPTGATLASFVVAPEGAVVNVSFTGMHVAVNRCIADALRAAPLPTAKAPTTVEWSFRYGPI